MPANESTKGERREEKRRASRKMRVHNAARWQQVRQSQAKKGPKKAD
ncbi:MAG: hypothetical protein HY261_04860 [Chloroflexi bacterium]|nr:hypothetical protein [Chloroflexota bacterium]